MCHLGVISYSICLSHKSKYLKNDTRHERVLLNTIPNSQEKITLFTIFMTFLQNKTSIHDYFYSLYRLNIYLFLHVKEGISHGKTSLSVRIDHADPHTRRGCYDFIANVHFFDKIKNT